MANFMARYRRSDGHYAGVECAYAEPERYLVLSCNEQERKGAAIQRPQVKEGKHTAEDNGTITAKH